MSKGGKVSETPQQRAMVQMATQKMADYKQRWLPVQQRLAQQVQTQGAEGSAARKAAEGKAATDTQLQFNKAQGALEKSLTNSGAGAGSSKANLAVTGMGNDLAKSKGLSTMIGDQQIDDAYTQGLSALMSIGQGKSASVGNAMANQARQSGMQAQADAQTSLANQQGMGELAGMAAGAGLQQWGNSSAPPKSTLPGMPNAPQGTFGGMP